MEAIGFPCFLVLLVFLDLQSNPSRLRKLRELKKLSRSEDEIGGLLEAS